MSLPPLRVAVVGGGATGLAAAYALERQAGREDGRLVAATLFEADRRLGGKIRTDRVGDLLLEEGPTDMFLRSPFALDVLRELGCEQDVVRAHPRHRSASILLHDRFHPLPPGMEGGVPRSVWPMASSHLLTTIGKLRAGLEIALPRRSPGGDESVDAFVRRRFGVEVAEHVAAPMLGSIYGDDTRRLSLLATVGHLRETERQHRSLLLAALAGKSPGARRTGTAASPFVALRSGLETLPATLNARLSTTDVRLGTRVVSLEPAGRDGQSGYALATADGARLEVDRVILTTPAYAAAELLTELAPPAARELRGIHYTSVIVVALVLPPDCERSLPAGTGYLAAPGEPRLMSACSWTSRKWPHVAPGGELLVRAHLHVDEHPELLDADDEALVAAVRQELRELLGLAAEPRVARVYRWPRSIAAYQVGHLDRLAAIDRALADVPGVILAGAGYRGAGIPECLRQGVEAAQRALGSSVAQGTNGARATSR